MSDEELKLLASTAIHALFSSGQVSTPVSSLSLLTRVISSKQPQGLFACSPSPRFRLTDLRKFEAILEDLARTWDRGVLSLSRDADGLSVVDAHLDTPGGGYFGDAIGKRESEARASRKRKRVVDEDADSAAGDDGADEDALEEPMPVHAPSSTLGGLSKEMKEVYAILQKSTAKGRLLAEQVRLRAMARRQTTNLASSVSLGERTLRAHLPARHKRRLLQSTAPPPHAYHALQEHHHLRPGALPPAHEAPHGRHTRPLLVPEYLLL